MPLPRGRYDTSHPNNRPSRSQLWPGIGGGDKKCVLKPRALLGTAVLVLALNLFAALRFLPTLGTTNEGMDFDKRDGRDGGGFSDRNNRIVGIGVDPSRNHIAERSLLHRPVQKEGTDDGSGGGGGGGGSLRRHRPQGELTTATKTTTTTSPPPPALIGAKRGRIRCDVNVDFMSYWNDPQGLRDLRFVSPFAAARSYSGGTGVGEDVKTMSKTKIMTTRYVTFEPDRGGWNNLRMSFENVVVFAAATGRTLVLPPDHPMYLLTRDRSGRLERNYGDFFDLRNLSPSSSFASRVNVITTEEFIVKEGGRSGGRFPIPTDLYDGVLRAKRACQHRDRSDRSCMRVYEYFARIGYVPNVHGETNCLIFDEGYLNYGTVDSVVRDRVQKFCRARQPVYYDKQMRDAAVVHFRTSEKEYRILAHFYVFVLFTNPMHDNFFKRFVRDRIHYNDAISCAAGKIVQTLRDEGLSRGFSVSDRGGGGKGRRGFSSLHIRRGDFQWKDTRLSAEEWYNNTKELWLDGEILYITTDEKNRSFFDPIAAHHPLRFIDDYWETVTVGQDNIVDPNAVGMVETLVAAQGRRFVGTYFSSFSAYIGRIRGYLGMSPKEMWYGQSNFKTETHRWVDPQSSYSAREFPVGWIGIDGDDEVTSFLD